MITITLPIHHITCNTSKFSNQAQGDCCDGNTSTPTPPPPHVLRSQHGHGKRITSNGYPWHRERFSTTHVLGGQLAARYTRQLEEAFETQSPSSSEGALWEIKRLCSELGRPNRSKLGYRSKVRLWAKSPKNISMHKGFECKNRCKK
jgi:hypothetical protein